MGMLFALSARAADGSGAYSSQEAKLSRSDLLLVKGDAFRLKLRNAGGNVSWSSMNKSVATVTSRGKVKARKSGGCVIQARSAGKTYRCKVTVCANKKEYKYRKLLKSHERKRNQGKILLAGASAMELWEDAAAAFAPYEILNMGISGSTSEQWLKWYKKLIVAYRPAAVVIFPGSRNEYRRSHSLSGATGHTCKLLRRLHRELPDVPVFCISLYNNYKYQKLWPKMKLINKKVKKLCRSLKNVYYIDLDGILHDGDDPKPGVIGGDDAHLSRYGYALWSGAIVPAVEDALVKR